MIDSRINADTEVCFRSDSARSLFRRSSVTRVGGRYTDLIGLLFVVFIVGFLHRNDVSSFVYYHGFAVAGGFLYSDRLLIVRVPVALVDSGLLYQIVERAFN